ncbi:T9SS type A sorting domain-containing protein [Chryseobacterium indologenes]|uniref:T9SS type A sorting domain-containing protein n=1 Tax=Chryseobacterium indologenes TaxID=253 RepID=UPI00188833B1|nr:T9SS type A sorting domain-containing protein [Chryseobacterium indologenes]MBF6646905.1 T9SS type A sorting domain-containing protein [Chryseobacterium indologenes]
MLENLFFVLKKIGIGASIAFTGYVLHAQTLPQNCNNTDPGGNTGDLGCVTFTYRGQQVVYTTVRGEDGKIWLQQNLGSAQVAASATDQDSYGDLFQWGRWDDGHQLRNSPVVSPPSPNTPSGITTGSYIAGSPAWWSGFAATDEWSGKSKEDASDFIGVDPCKAIAVDWRMPLQAEWASLVSAANITNPATAYNSHLKLPAGGYRGSGNGDFTFVGQRGYFWSSDTSGSGGKYLYIGATIANPSSGGPRGQGASVRCIKTVSGLGTSDTPLKSIQVGVSPNPTKGILLIKTDTAIENVSAVNAAGQKLDIKMSDHRIDMSSFPNGLYILELKLKGGQSVFKKIIKE